MNPKRKPSRVIGPLCGLIIVSLWMWSVSKAAPLPATLSAQTISSPTTISSSGNDATRPVIAVDNSNNLYVAWEQNGETGGNRDIFQSSNSGSGWSTPASVYASSDNSWRPGMAAGPNGDIHIIWKEETVSTVYTTVYQKGLAPTTPISITPVITLATAHDIAVDSANTPHLVQQGNKSTTSTTPYDILYSQGAVADTPVYTGGSGTGSQYPSITADSQDNLHLVWQETEGGADGVIYYSQGVTGSGSISWMTATPIPTYSVVITDAARPSITIDDNNTLHLVWIDHLSKAEQYIYYARSPATPTTWITPTRIMTQSVGVNDASPSYVAPVIAVFSDTIYVAWHDNTNDSGSLEDIYYTSSTNAGTTWATPVNVSNSDNVQSLHPQIVADGQGAVHFVWQEKVSGKWEVQYARSQAGGVFLPIIVNNS